MKLEETIKNNELMSVYGKLLTEKQNEILSAYFQDDLSLSEIAYNYGTTRQAVSDIINRSVNILKNYEDKLKIVEKNKNIIKKIDLVKSRLTDNSIVNTINEIVTILED